MKRTGNTLFGIIFIILLAFPINSIYAQISSEREITPEEIQMLNTGRKLLADKVDVKMETAVIDSIIMLFEMREEEKMSPADDLYDGMWNNRYVKAYSGITIPDTFRIDLSSFVMPIEGRVTSQFGPRGRRFHYGTDIKLYIGDTVVAAFEGKVRVKQYERSGYGYYLVLRHPNGLETVYGHLSKYLVAEGETVEAGQPIALGGNTGRSTGSHLHFECRLLGQAINPADMVDFSNFCTFDDSYVFQKSKANENTFTAANGTITYHTIRRGDTLSRIALRYRVSIDQLCRLNGISRTTTLRIGRVLRCS